MYLFQYLEEFRNFLTNQLNLDEQKIVIDCISVGLTPKACASIILEHRKGGKYDESFIQPKSPLL